MTQDIILFEKDKFCVGIAKEGYYEGFGHNYCHRNILKGAGFYIEHLLHEIDLKNQDNDALSRYCEMLEQKIAQLANMQDKKVILE